MEQAKALASALKGSIGTVIKGKGDVIEKVILCLLSGGHVLLEDVPGTGKNYLGQGPCRFSWAFLFPCTIHTRSSAVRPYRRTFFLIKGTDLCVSARPDFYQYPSC